MRIIEKCWIDVHQGYETILALEARLKSDWKRAIQIVQKRDDLDANARRIKTQKIVGFSSLALALICVLSCAGFYFWPEERLQLFIYVCMLAVPGIILLVISMYIFGAGRKSAASLPSLELEESWWRVLTPKQYEIQKGGQRGEIKFLKSLSFLDNNYIAVWGLLTSAKIRSDTDVLLLGPNGIWIFEVKYWNGAISKKDGVWVTKNRFGKMTTYEKGPDEQWLDQKEELAKTIKMRLGTWNQPAELIRGGVVFAHSYAQLGEINNSMTSYGTPLFWHKQIREAKSLDGFPIKDRLLLLDALTSYANLHEKEVIHLTSAKEAANGLYRNTESKLREYVSEKLK